MASDSNAAGDWAAAMQKAQAELLRQWSEISQAAMRAGMPLAPSGTGSGASGEALVRQFMQQCEQYLGVSRSLWDLVTKAAAIAEPEQRARVFADGVGALQQQFAQLWAAGPLGTPATAGFGWPGAPPFAAGSPGLGAIPGFAGFPGVSGWPGMGGFPGMTGALGMPALGPAREQQESLQRLAQLSMRCARRCRSVPSGMRSSARRCANLASG
jgi:hypothetical protein